jgi:hypothetical protein
MTEYNFDCESRDENTSFRHHVVGIQTNKKLIHYLIFNIYIL